MNKPITPKKPLQRDDPPKEKLELRFALCENRDRGDFFLTPLNQLSQPIQDEYWDMVTNVNLHFSDMVYIHKKLIPKVEDFKIYPQTNCDGYFEYWVISYMVENPNFEKELKEFETRFETYEKRKQQYQEDLLAYKIWKQQEDIKKLEKQLEVKKLESNK